MQCLYCWKKNGSLGLFKILAMKKYFLGACLLYAASIFAQQDGQATIKNGQLKHLFNHKNLHDWYSFLPSKGKNNDVDNVFKVEDSLLHISGKEFGYICTNKSYRNFVLVVEFKWGEKKWPPRDADTTKRDNGILFFVPEKGKDTVWPRSVECQIQEGDVGDFWMVDSTTIVVNGVRTTPKDFIRSKKTADNEKPHGQWNTVVVTVNNGNISYLVNGVKVNDAAMPATVDGKPLRRGKIIVQSEGAEIYYRKIDITELK